MRGPLTFRPGLEEEALALAAQPVGDSAGVDARQQIGGCEDRFLCQGVLQGVSRQPAVYRRWGTAGATVEGDFSPHHQVQHLRLWTQKVWGIYQETHRGLDPMGEDHCVTAYS